MSKKTAQPFAYPAVLVSLLLGVLAGSYGSSVKAESWSCPFAEIQVGSGRCTSRGCKLYKGMDDSFGAVGMRLRILGT